MNTLLPPFMLAFLLQLFLIELLILSAAVMAGGARMVVGEDEVTRGKHGGRTAEEFLRMRGYMVMRVSDEIGNRISVLRSY